MLLINYQESKNSVILKLRGKSNEKEIKEKLITNNILKGVNNDK